MAFPGYSPYALTAGPDPFAPTTPGTPPGVPAQGPSTAPANSPVPPNPSFVQGWENFLGRLAEDKNLQMSLIQAGLQMMTPRQSGENDATKILQGTQQGLQTYVGLNTNDQQAELRRQQIEAAKRENRVGGETVDAQIAKTQADAKTAQNQATISGGQAKVADTTAMQELENLKSRNSWLTATTAEVREQIKNIQSMIKDRESGAGAAAGDRRGSDQIWVTSYVDALVGPRTKENAAAWDEAFRRKTDSFQTQGIQKNPEQLRAEMYLDARLAEFPEEDEMAQTIKTNIDTWVDAYKRDLESRMASGSPESGEGSGGLLDLSGIPIDDQVNIMQAATLRMIKDKIPQKQALAEILELRRRQQAGN